MCRLLTKRTSTVPGPGSTTFVVKPSLGDAKSSEAVSPSQRTPTEPPVAVNTSDGAVVLVVDDVVLDVVVDDDVDEPEGAVVVVVLAVVVVVDDAVDG